MKYFKILTIALLSTMVSFYACSDGADTRKQEARESLEVSDSPTLPDATTPPNPATPEPPQNAEGVWHYTCSKGCAGGAGSAGTCATCGGPLAHNQAYHANANSTTPNTPSATPPTTPTATPTPEPAQNAAGVWHYTCGKGCAGGAGSAGTCATCGGALAHNAAYHQ